MLDVPTTPILRDWDRRQVIESLVHEFIALRAKGDPEAINARLAADFVYRTHGTWPMWPYNGGPLDRAQFAAASARVNAELELISSEFHEFLIDADSAAVHATFAMRNRGSGPPVEFDLWMVFRFRDRLISEAAFYVDAAKAARMAPSGIIEIRPRDPKRKPRGAPKASPDAARHAAPATDPETGATDGESEDARNRAMVERTVRDFFVLRMKNDFEGLLDRLAPDFVYNPRGSWTRLPLAPGRCDRAAFAESLRQIEIEFDQLEGETHELLIDGDRVAAHRTYLIRDRGAGVAVHGDAWLCFRVRAGLIEELAAYIDTVRAAAAELPPYGTRR